MPLTSDATAARPPPTITRDEIAISEPNVALGAVTAALQGWEEWAALHVADNGFDRAISLPAIQRRIQSAGLGLKQPQ